MRKRLQIALMASTVAATSLSLTSQLRAEGGDGVSEKTALQRKFYRRPTKTAARSMSMSRFRRVKFVMRRKQKRPGAG